MYSNQRKGCLDKKLLINHNRPGQISAGNDKPFKQNNPIISLIAGIIGGYCFAQIFKLSFTKIYEYDEISNIYTNHNPKLINTQQMDFGSHIHTDENTTIADLIFDQVNVLCWIMTSPEYHKENAKYIKETWGSRCNKLIFMSSVEDKKLGAVVLSVSGTQKHVWGETKEAIKYLYQNHLDEYDWFLKADDDTYVILENLRNMLYAYNKEFPVYFGSKFEPTAKEKYLSSGGGYVLSREAVRRLVEKAFPDGTKCQQKDNDDANIELEKCMQNVGIIAVDSRDEHERGRILQFSTEDNLLAAPNANFSLIGGTNCCSDHAISFHIQPPREMYVVDYFIYHVRTFGITNAPDTLPDKKSLNEIYSDIPNNNKSATKFSST